MDATVSKTASKHRKDSQESPFLDVHTDRIAGSWADQGIELCQNAREMGFTSQSMDASGFFLEAGNGGRGKFLQAATDSAVLGANAAKRRRIEAVPNMTLR